MAHSRIFQINNKPIPEDEYIEEHYFYEDSGFVGQVADYVSDETDRDEDIEDLVTELKRYDPNVGFYKETGKITLPDGFKIKYFADRYEKLKEYIKDMTVEKFVHTYESLTIRTLVEDKFGFYVYHQEDGYPITLDRFVRQTEGEVSFYVGKTIDYHY